MTDNNLVKNELKLLLDIADSEIDSYAGFIEYAVNCVGPLIKDGENENDIRLVHLCAVKAYYQISITQNDGISSFTAGEVSYSRDTSVADRARLLLDEALAACCGLINSNDFAFKVV